MAHTTPHPKSLQLEQPQWQRIVRYGVTGSLFIYAGLQVISLKTLSAILVVGLLALILFVFPLERKLLWWLFLASFRAWHARACVDILNWKNACALFVNKLSIWTTDRRNDELNHFKWTCHCGRIFDETAREMVPGAVGEWIDAWSFCHDPTAQVSASTDREASLFSRGFDIAARYRSTIIYILVWASCLILSISAVWGSTMFFFDFDLWAHTTLIKAVNNGVTCDFAFSHIHCDHRLETESGGPLAQPYQIVIHQSQNSVLLIATLVSSLILSLSVAWYFHHSSDVRAAVIGETGALLDSEVDTDAKGVMLGSEDTGLLPQTIEPADTSLGSVIGEPIAAPYAETIGVEQGGRAPRDGNSPPSPNLEREDAPPHFEYVLLLIKQGRHRMQYFSANIQRKWTDQDTFSTIKEHYNYYKSSWWYLNTLSHVEFKKFYIYHSNYIDIADGEKEEVPICEQKCESGCGLGCLGYWYTPPRVKMIPPIPRKAMLHFLESPDCLGNDKRNRAALPKRRNTLKLGDLHLREGWGLRFKEKVWSLPIVTIQLLSIISAIVVTVCWTVFTIEGINSLVPGAFILLIGQSIAALLQRWAESNLDEEPKAR